MWGFKLACALTQRPERTEPGVPLFVCFCFSFLFSYLPLSQQILKLVLTDKQVTRVLDVVFEGHQQLRYVLNKKKLAIVVKKLVIRKRVGEGIRLAVQYVTTPPPLRPCCRLRQGTMRNS